MAKARRKTRAPRKAKGRELNVPSLAIYLEEKDFPRVAPRKRGTGEMDFVTTEAEEVPISTLSEEERKEQVSRVLPDIIARKLEQAVPTGFELSQITFTGEISGKPFGVGVSGSVEVLFERPKKT